MTVILEGFNKSGITTRFTFRLDDKHVTKAALVERPEKTIICLSTQVGCSGRCEFCSAREMELVRDLKIDELISITTRLSSYSLYRDRRTLISLMGTGEPLMNANNVRGLYTKFGDIPNFSLALSTSGYGIEGLHMIPSGFKVQFTLVSPVEEVRESIQPGVCTIDQLINAIENYKGKKEINVPLIEGVNDTRQDMRKIARIAKRVGCSVKLNRLNPTGTDLNPVSPEMTSVLVFLLRFCDVDAECYETDGQDIYAACGQFEIDPMRKVKKAYLM